MFEDEGYERQSTVYQNQTTSPYSGGYTEPAKPEKQSGGVLRKIALSICLGLCFGLFAGVGFYAVNLATEKLGVQQEQVSELPDETQTQTSALIGNSLSTTDTDVQTTTVIQTATTDITEVVTKVMPSMVSVTEHYTYRYGYNFFGQSIEEDAEAAGSGIIIGETDDEYLIVTNNHVVADAESLEVTFVDDSTVEAHIKGTDSAKDLAIIAVAKDAVEDSTKAQISIATLGDSSQLQLGESVIAIGNALGYGQSVTNGIVSALEREVTTDDGYTNKFIQTNAAINPGNSGGALLNMAGQVIGINSNKIGGSSVEGMGYAIPISDVLDILEDLMSKTTLIRVSEDEIGYIGISLQEITAQMASTFDMPQGIYVVEVLEGGAAQQAGLLKGDVITAFDGRSISSYDELQNVLQYYAAGSTVSITYERQENGVYVEHTVDLTLGYRPAQN
jgi:serine protease Do